MMKTIAIVCLLSWPVKTLCTSTIYHLLHNGYHLGGCAKMKRYKMGVNKEKPSAILASPSDEMLHRVQNAERRYCPTHSIIIPQTNSPLTKEPASNSLSTIYSSSFYSPSHPPPIEISQHCMFWQCLREHAVLGVLYGCVIYFGINLYLLSATKHVSHGKVLKKYNN